MRLCANENMSETAVALLRHAGHDVVWIREVAPGLADAGVLEMARAGDRLLLTFDKDFGELVFRLGATASCGVVLLRISQPSAVAVAERIIRILESRDDWPGHFSVVEDTMLRMRPLPRA
jgi:predicted nuclease of predicted toxin-antitoxin system